MKSMKKLFNFIYILTIIFVGVGGGGNLFYFHKPQFAIPLLILSGVLILNYFKVINLPNKDWFS